MKDLRNLRGQALQIHREMHEVTDLEVSFGKLKDAGLDIHDWVIKNRQAITGARPPPSSSSSPAPVRAEPER